MQNIVFHLITYVFFYLILLKFIWFLTINRIQVEFKKEGYASIWPEGITMKKCIFLFVFPLNNFSINEWNSLKFIWYMPRKIKYRLSLKKKVKRQFGQEIGPPIDMKYCKFWVPTQ